MSDTSSKETEPVPASRPQKIPVGWETRRLSELATNHDSKRVPLKQTDRDRRRGDYPYYGASGIIDSIDGFLFDGDFVLLGEDGENVVSRHLPLAFRVTGKFWVNNHAHVYEPCHEVDIRFLVGLLDATDFSGLVSGSAQPKLTQEALQRLRFIVPPYGEQRAIAAVLDTIDDAIQKTEQIIAKLQQLKQGLLHDLLTRGIDDNGELRDPERHPEQFQDSPLGRIPKGWAVVPLGSIALGGLVNGVFKEPGRAGRGIPLVNVGDLYGDFGVNLDRVERFDANAVETSKFGVRPGDIYFTRSSLNLMGIAHCNIVRSVDKEAVFECHVMRLRPDARRANAAFLALWCRAGFARSFFMGRAKQVTMTTISQADIYPLPTPLPPCEEQQQIVDAIDSMDARLQREVLYAEKIRAEKQSVANDLLTGRVRTTSIASVGA